MTDLPLFALAQAHSETSRAAASAIEPRVGTLEAAVLAHVIACGYHGATDEEIADALDMTGSTERPRRVTLVRRGLLVDSTIRRLTRSGRLAVVWMHRDVSPVTAAPPVPTKLERLREAAIFALSHPIPAPVAQALRQALEGR